MKLRGFIQNLRNNPKIAICDIIIAVQAIVIVAMAMGLSAELAISQFKGYEDYSFYYSMKDGQYERMVRMYHYNEAYDVRQTSELTEYYGVARYYEAASLYKAYLASGDTQKAADYKATMDEVQDQMGAFSSQADAIEEQLGGFQ